MPRLLSPLVLLLALAATPLAAGPKSDAMGQCLVASTTGADRIDLVRWIVLAYSKHPSVSDYVTTDPEKDEEVERRMAALVERLVVDDCADASRAAFTDEGPLAMQSAFEALGRVAGVELLNDRAVMEAVSGFARHLDQDRLNEVLR